MFIFLGWAVGVLLAAVVAVPGFVALGIPVATLIGALAALPLSAILPLLSPIIAALGALGAALAALLAGLGVILAILLVLVAIFIACFLAFLLGYVIATSGVGGSFPGVPFPRPPRTLLTPPGGIATPTTATAAEFFGRGWMIGLNAGCNFALLMLLTPFDAVWAPRVALWAFVLISLAAVVPVAGNRVFQGFLGWSGWLLPLAWLGTFPGLVLFLFNAIASRFSPPLPGLPALTVTVDPTTGVVESAEGFITRLTTFAGGFTQGNFTFLVWPTAARAILPAAFGSPSVSTHEIGHSLNTAAMGGVVLWINAIDENLLPFRRNDLAYGELTAESRAQLFGPARPRFFVRLWF
ncbi:hypothetical protein [Amaricoccus sp.]|uniref:hypothetical protein n=1 Tax=Amaricoccus sp. TaxID=1872485 RepID=UPI001B6C540D|nr:hypothetical protein [Amaricoccus sp.]MBP7002300.1 hypothetical protein [Amaricoccus sp.]